MKLFGTLLILSCFTLAPFTIATELATRKVITTDSAPQAIGPYSQAVQVGQTLYLAGQIAIDPKTGKMSEGGIEIQTHLVINNISAVLEAAGYSLHDVVQSQVFMTNISSFAAMNEIYRQYFEESPPARAVVEVSRLPRNALIEIMVTAAK